MIDNEMNNSFDIEYQLVELGNKTYEITIIPSDKWLESASYPVTIDPTISSIQSTGMSIQDTYYNATYSTNSHSDSIIKCTGEFDNIGLINFTVPTTLKDHQVVFATLNLTTTENNGGGELFVNEVDNYTDLSMYPFDPSVFPITLVNRASVESGSQSYHIDITYSVNNWNELEIENMPGFQLNTSGTNEIIFYSSDATGLSDYLTTERPFISIGYFDSEDLEGLKDYWTYNSQDISAAGTGYISDFTQQLYLVRNDFSFQTDLQSIGLSFSYSNNMTFSSSPNIGYGNGWNVNYNLMLHFDANNEEIYSIDFTGNKINYYPLEVCDSRFGVNDVCYIAEDGSGDILVDFDSSSTYSGASIVTSNGTMYNFDVTSGTETYLEKIYELYSDLETTISRSSATSKLVNYVSDTAGNKLDFDYDGNNRLVSITLKTIDSNSTLHNLEKVYYVYYGSTNFLHDIYYLTDYDQDGDLSLNTSDLTNVDKIVRYDHYASDLLSKGFVKYIDEDTGLESLGEEIRYHYYSGDDYKVSYIESYFDSTKYSQINYDNNYSQTKVSDHSGSFVQYSFDTFGHTISLIDNEANALYYSYIDIYRLHELMGDDDYDYNLNHKLYSESSPDIPTSDLITNSSFEDGKEDWTTWNTCFASDDSVEVSTTEKTSGNYALDIHLVYDAFWSGAHVSREIILDEGYYSLSVDIKNEGSESGNHVWLRIGSEYRYVPNDSQWHTVSIDFFVDEPDTTIDVILLSNTLGHVYFDNVLLTNKFDTAQANLIHNSSFEEGLSITNEWALASQTTATIEQITYGTSDVDATFESILGDQAIQLTGAMQTSIYREAFENYIDGDIYSMYIGGWSKNLTAPYITNGYTGIFYGILVNQYDSNGGLIEKTEDVDGYNTSVYIPFDLHHHNWQFSYKSVIIDEDCERLDITLIYYGSGDVQFDGLTMFFNSDEVIKNYDDYGRLTGEYYGDNTSVAYTYPSNTDQYTQIPETFTDRDGNVTTYSQSNNRITGILKNNVKISPTYNSYGQMETYYVGTSNDLDAYFTRSTNFDSTGQYMYSSVDEYGETTTYYNDLVTGLLEYINNANNVDTNYEYYDDGSLKKVYVDYIDDKDNTTTSYVEYIYDEYERLIEINLDTGYSYYIIYDSLGRMESVRVNNQTLMSYDYIIDVYETNIISSQTYEGTGDIIYFNYDDNNKNITSIDFQASGMTRETRFTYTYDSQDRIIIYEDLIINSKEYYEYDTKGNLVTITFDNGDVYEYDYDDDGNIVGYTCNINDETITSNYDYVESSTYNELYDSTSYNLSGTNDSLIKDYIYEDASSVIDPLGRIQSIHFTITGISSIQFDIEYTYEDYTSRIERIEYNFVNNNLDFSYDYQYDSLGNITQEIYTFYDTSTSSTQTIQKDYTYDDLTQLTIENSRDSRYLISDYEPTNYTKYYHYDERGNLYEINSHKYGDPEDAIYSIPSFYQENFGSKDAYMQYNLTNDYQDIYSISVGGNVSLSFRYIDVTGLGELSSISSAQLEKGAGQDSVNMLLVPSGYILGMTTTLISSNLDTSTEGYYYNYYQATNGGAYTIRFRIVIKVGDPVSIYPEESLTTYYKDYPSGWRDQLSSYTILENGQSSTSSFTYDNQGNPTKITNFYYEGTRYNHADLFWEGRTLVGIQIYSTSLTTSKIAEIWYTYNDQGIRTSKIIDIDGDGTQDEKYEYSLSGDVLLSEIIYYYTTTWFEDYQIIYTYDYDGRLIGFTCFDGASTEDYIYTFNIQGDVTKILKSDGTVVVEYFYDGYGNIVETTGTLASTIGDYNSMRYRGYKYEDEIRMYYLNSRYYLPEIGRFINTDGMLGQVGSLGTNNVYSYCANNPVMFTDSTGMSPKTWMIISSIALITVGIIFIGSGGGILVSAGAGSLLGGFTNEFLGGKFEAGWVGGLISGTLLAAGAMAGAELLYLAAEAKGLAVLGLLAGSVISSYGIAGFGGGLGSYVQQRMDHGASGIDRDKIYLNSLMYGFLGLTGSLIPQGSVVSPLGRGWAAAFCIAGEIIIDAATWFYEMVGSGEIELPRPIFV